MTSSSSVSGSSSDGRDYSDSLLLPKTDFAMRAKLVAKEQDLLAHWRKLDVENLLRQKSKGKKKFILHDGPPYANGDLHMGHALNKILKDFIIRSFQMMDYDASYVPGWDCHGLPIEWRVEEEYRESGQNKDEIPITAFRKECRAFARKWIDIQSAQFQRLGISGDWQNPYTTMSYGAEAKIAAELLALFAKGQIYRGSKPVMWSVVEHTALAEAEIEYHDYKSDMVWVGFPVKSADDKDLQDARIVIWTTTPWTLPSNRAIAYSSKIDYGVYRVTLADEDNWLVKGQKIIVADKLSEQTRIRCRVEKWQRIKTVDPANIICCHPLNGLGYDFDVPVLFADFVKDDEGTGFVHIAPEHGPDDYNLGLKAGIEISKNVLLDGSYAEHVPLFSGIKIQTTDGKKSQANEKVIEALKKRNALFARATLRHKYPHSWRSKAPILFLNTPQWFVSMQDENSTDGLRQRALASLEKIRFVPSSCYHRLYDMVKNRPDWVISRQRSWGVPIAVFTDKKSGKVLIDKKVNQRIIKAFKEHGADIWYDKPAQFFLADDYNSEDYEQIRDILDVWFESGTTFSFVLEENEKLQYPADLYLEGSDQHRGWFQSSLLVSNAARMQAPYRQILTHGFVLDAKGRKMSKSLGNTVSPQQVIEKHGAEILRMWVASSDYSEDMNIGEAIIRQNIDNYRKIRNSIRFLLGNLSCFDANKTVSEEAMPQLERYILSKLTVIDSSIRKSYQDYDFKGVFSTLFHFCILDLSAFYFDIRKDCLYCEQVDSTKRLACLQVLDTLFSCLSRWLAPILCFTSEEAHQARYPEAKKSSIHLLGFPEIPSRWRDPKLEEQWQAIRKLRQVVNGAIEIKRKNRDIGSSLEADVTLFISDDSYQKHVENVDLAEIFITSKVEIKWASPPEDAFMNEALAKDIGVILQKAKGKKCARSWRIIDETVSDPKFPDLSLRDAAVMRNLSDMEPFNYDSQ